MDMEGVRDANIHLIKIIYHLSISKFILLPNTISSAVLSIKK